MEYLNNLIRQYKYDEALAECENEKLYPVGIATYKLRKGNNVRTLASLPTDVYLFVYEDDYAENKAEYDDIVNSAKNVRIIQIDHTALAYRGLTTKLNYMMTFFQALGVDKFWRLDDDLKDYVEVTEGLSKSRRKLPLYQGMKLLQALTKDKEYGLVTAEFNVGFIKFWNQKELGSNFATCSCCVLVNAKLAKENGINYDLYFKEGCEDDDLCFQFYNKNIPTYRAKFMGLSFTIALQASGNTFTTNHDIGKLKLFNKWGNVVTTKLKLNKRTGNIIFFHKPNFKKSFQDFQLKLQSEKLAPIFEIAESLDLAKLEEYLLEELKAGNFRGGKKKDK